MDLTSIRSSGQSADRIDIVIVAEGYTADEREKFLADAKTFTDYMLSKGNARLNDPFATYASLMNASAVFVASNQSGYSTDTETRDTAFGSKAYLSDGRLVYGDTGKVYQALSDLTGDARDLVIVLINSDKYGGAGGSVAWATAGNPLSFEVALHEIGHSFAGLQDEYIDTAIAENYPLSVLDHSAHVSTHASPDDVPWKDWIGYSDELGTVGVYEGGYYRATGVWRATETSKMLYLDTPFSAPEKEAFIDRFYLSTANLVTPQAQTSLTRLSVSTPSARLFDFTWTIDGAAAGTDSAGLDLRNAILGRSDGAVDLAVALTVTDGTGLVRKASVLADSTETESFALHLSKATLDPVTHVFAAASADNWFVTGSSAGDSIVLKGRSANLSWVEAGDGADIVTGGNGSDQIFGGSGDDRLTGGAGRDQLLGGAGADRLSGGDGADVLTGGSARDLFTGGAGNDRFVFDDGDFGAKTTSGCDRILDFTKGDRIDLSAVDGDTRAGHGGDQAFAFIGTAAFNTGDAAIGELRCAYSATSTYIYGDQNGDGRADFMLALTGTTPLAASDFVL
ncbi:M64 family metallopeptidase [Novosphingobium percolationis]|uniref:M64 family metallopeptidase n=1 Tax=Novosphingobium percolationis TaxID=2871811 RepID=UPI001CD48E9B|nr:M64 family metallopeptidase [Novosphingobium percolationis]